MKMKNVFQTKCISNRKNEANPCRNLKRTRRLDLNITMFFAAAERLLLAKNLRARDAHRSGRTLDGAGRRFFSLRLYGWLVGLNVFLVVFVFSLQKILFSFV